MPQITEDQAVTFERCMSVGGVAVLPTDTVYGLACDAYSEDAAKRMYRLKGRSDDKPSAVLFFQLQLALAALPSIGPRLQIAIERLLPGALTLLIPNLDRRFLAACGADSDTLGLRVPVFNSRLAALNRIEWPVVQSSANPAGGNDPCEVQDIPQSIRDEVDLILDAGMLLGVPSTVVDLRHFESDGEWIVLRQGAVSTQEIADALA